jgi:hypothetical protein
VLITDEQKKLAKEELEQLIQEGKVKKTFLLPLEIGGQDIPQNTIWFPVSSVSKKEKIEEKVYEAVKNGEQIEYSATPVYNDSEKISYIPIKLRIYAIGNKGLQINEDIV